jgi:ATP-dependent Clp protease ATP-binding subunit ClpA
MLKQAFDEAQRLGQSWVGPEHILLAVLAEPSPVSQVLAELGLNHDRLVELLGSRRHYPPAPELQPGEAPRLNPAFYQAAGWARGFAAAAGLRKPETGDWLLATIYRDGQGDDLLLTILQEIGTSPEAVLEEMRQRGLRIPTLKPPQYRPWRGERMVEVAAEELEPILKVLRQRHPPGSEWRWGFNVMPGDPQRSYVVSEDGIDLETIVAAARRR